MKIIIFKNKKTFKKGGIHRDPDIYWGLSLLVAFILVIVAIVYAVNLFSKINSGLSAPGDNEGVQIGTISKNRIENVLDFFSKRKQNFDEIISSPSPVLDPSL